MFTLQLSRGEQTRQYSLRNAIEGWELEEREDRRTVRHVRYQDWHRVERAIAIIQLEVDHLEREGWILQHGSRHGADDHPHPAYSTKR